MPIFDQGYQHWSGRLRGHAWRPAAIASRGVRSGLKGMITRLVFISALTPPLALAGVLSVWGLVERNSKSIQPYLYLVKAFISPGIVADPKHYRVVVWTLAYNYFLQYELEVSMILILLVGPSLISQDLRFNALPLYFSRPLRRIDYFLGKLGVVGAFLALVMILPSIAAYGLGMFFSLDLTIIRDTFGILLASVAYGLIVVLSAGTLVLALSALSRNSRYITLLWMAVWLVTMLMAVMLEGIDHSERQMRAYQAANADYRMARVDRRQMTPQLWAQEIDQRRARRQAAMQAAAIEIQAESTHDWRPLVSYTDNLARLRRALLGSDDAWNTVADVAADPGEDREYFLSQHVGAGYPWYWSAGVLIGLLGLSACMLHFPIRSLDRLK